MAAPPVRKDCNESVFACSVEINLDQTSAQNSFAKFELNQGAALAELSDGIRQSQ
jgi:hypothetical protein